MSIGSSSLFSTSTITLSFVTTLTVGPGNCPLTRITYKENTDMLKWLMPEASFKFKKKRETYLGLSLYSLVDAKWRGLAIFNNPIEIDVRVLGRDKRNAAQIGRDSEEEMQENGLSHCCM